MQSTWTKPSRSPWTPPGYSKNNGSERPWQTGRIIHGESMDYLAHALLVPGCYPNWLRVRYIYRYVEVLELIIFWLAIGMLGIATKNLKACPKKKAPRRPQGMAHHGQGPGMAP